MSINPAHDMNNESMNTREDYENLENAVNTNYKLKEKFTFDKIRPKAIIYGTSNNMDNEQLIKSLKPQNEALN